MRETQAQSLDREDPLEKGMATHSSILTWRIPWTEEPGRLQSTGSQRVRHNWDTNTLTVSGLQTLPAQSLLCYPAMVSPPEFFDIAIDASPSAASPSSCLEDKVAKIAENLHILSTTERGFDYKSFCFLRIVLVNICQGGVFTRHNGTSGKFIYGEKIDESSIRALVPCPWQMLAPRQFPIFYVHY